MNRSTEGGQFLPTGLQLEPARSVLAMFKSKELSPVEYFASTMDWIGRANVEVNALVDTYADTAMAAARRSEERYLRNEEVGALDGLLISIKDQTPIQGRRATQGSLLLRDHVDTESSVVIQRVENAGGIIHARSATPEFCCVPYTHSELWGVTRNPWNLKYSPGGSSGGSGASLAAGMASLANGTDYGGSTRIPAAFCGVVGFKPPYGRVPGANPLNLDTFYHEGPMARTVDDCALFQDVLAGPHFTDAASVPLSAAVSSAELDVRGWKIAVSFDSGGYQISDEVRAAITRAARVFADLGAIVEEVEVGWSFEDVQRAFAIHMGLNFAGGIADQIQETPEAVMEYTRKIAERAASIRKQDRAEGMALEAGIQRALGNVMNDYRVLLCPAVATTGLLAGVDPVGAESGPEGIPVTSSADAPWGMPFNMCRVFNICSRNPVLSVPSGVLSSAGVPIGMQIVGRPYDDASVFVAARAHESAVSWPLRP